MRNSWWDPQWEFLGGSKAGGHRLVAGQTLSVELNEGVRFGTDDVDWFIRARDGVCRTACSMKCCCDGWLALR